MNVASVFDSSSTVEALVIVLLLRYLVMVKS